MDASLGMLFCYIIEMLCKWFIDVLVTSLTVFLLTTVDESTLRFIWSLLKMDVHLFINTRRFRY